MTSFENIEQIVTTSGHICVPIEALADSRHLYSIEARKAEMYRAQRDDIQARLDKLEWRDTWLILWAFFASMLAFGLACGYVVRGAL